MTALYDSGVRVTLDNITSFAEYEYREMTVKSVSYEYPAITLWRV